MPTQRCGGRERSGRPMEEVRSPGNVGSMQKPSGGSSAHMWRAVSGIGRRAHLHLS